MHLNSYTQVPKFEEENFMADKWEKGNTERIGEIPLSPSIPAGDNTVWADVSSLIQLACNDLRSEDLINGEDFNFFAAMTALEIMDPKMDSGVVSTFYSIDEAIDNNAAPVPLSFDRTIDIQGVIDVMDHLLVCEATWHKGGSLAQTVFSCLYILRPERTSAHALLQSFCRVVRATCNCVISAVSDARTNEEEDIFTMAYGLSLKEDGDDKCLSMLHAVDEIISRQLKASKAPVPPKNRVSEDIEPLQNNPDLEEGFCKAVLCRLRFRKHFYHVLTCMRRPQGKGLELAKKHISVCLSELDSMSKSEDFLRHNTACGLVVETMEVKTTASGREPIGFDSTVNSKCAAPSPPRTFKLLGWKKAVNYFRKLLHDLEVICSYSLAPAFEDALRFVVDFQKFKPDLVARAYIQVLLVQDGKLYGRDPMFAVICDAALLPEGTKNHEIQKNETVVQLGQLLINLLRVLCTNIAWQRRKLGKILQEWRIMSMQLELAFRKEFGDLNSTSMDKNVYLTTYKHILIWVEEQTYWIALRFLMLGFELELYSASEYCMVYWYIYVILIKLAKKTHLKLMLDNNSSRRKTKKKKDTTKDMGKDMQIPPAVLLLQCYIYVAEGLMMMLASLRNEDKAFRCQGLFNSEQERFNQHFELLQKAGLHDQTAYFLFRETADQARLSSLAVNNCFKEAQRIARELRGNIAKDEAEIRRIEQVTEHNIVAINLISRLENLDPSLKISFEFIHHPQFAVAALKMCSQ